MREARNPELVVLLVILALMLGAGAALALDALQQAHSRQRSETFQHLVGGLGFGPALDLSRCACSFDPRLRHCCSQNLGPIPGGRYFCPQHAGSVFYYAELPNANDSWGRGTPHAHVP